MKKYTNNGKDFVREGQNVLVAGKSYYCPNESWLNDNGYFEYVEQWGDSEDGVVDNKWVHYKGLKPMPPTPQTPPEPTPGELLEQARRQKLNEIEYYDTSEDVNGFTLNGQHMWLSLDERKSMRQSLIALKAQGIETFTYWNNLSPITMPVAQFEAIMNAVEVYALQCFNVTAQHKLNVTNLATIEEINKYDITTGYPDKLQF